MAKSVYHSQTHVKLEMEYEAKCNNYLPKYTT